MIPPTLAQVIVGLTFFASGLALFLAWHEVRRAWAERTLWPLAYASARCGFVIMVCLIAEQVFHSQSLSLSWRTALYTTGATLVSVGYVFVALDQRRRDRRWGDRNST